MIHKVKSIEPGSLAEQLGILPGDELISLNGEKVVDFIDYQALCNSEQMNIVIRRGSEETEYVFEKDDFEPLGIELESDMMGTIRTCVNNCVFCFVDQLPENVRESMKVKDDDWRLSLLTGSYVTLTNVTDAELDRIIKRQASPLYISVHATDTEMRKAILRSQADCDIMSKLKKLAEGGICFHAQTVVCPGINDGKVLENTIDDLFSLYPACLSLAVVPVGLTCHRDSLCAIKPFDKASAIEVLKLVNRKRRECLRESDTRFVFPSDELYLTACEELPADSEYEDYAQIDNGVGLCRQLETDLEFAYDDLSAKLKKTGKVKKHIAIATGVSAKPVLDKMLERFPISGVEVKVYAVENSFFGSTVTVAGLVTGNDLVKRMRNVNCDAILITECMLRNEGDRFLDDMTLTNAVKLLGKPIIPVGRRGEDLLDAILQFSDVR